MEGFSSGAESDGAYSPRARRASRLGSGDDSSRSLSDDSPAQKRVRVASMDGGRDRGMSFMDTADLDSLWRDVDSPRMHAASSAAPGSSNGPDLSGKDIRGGSPKRSGVQIDDDDMESLDLSPSSKSTSEQASQQPKIELPKIKLDPEKCLKIDLVLKSDSDKGSSSERKNNSSSSSGSGRPKRPPLVDWDKATPILMRRKRFDPQRGVY